MFPSKGWGGLKEGTVQNLKHGEKTDILVEAKQGTGYLKVKTQHFCLQVISKLGDMC